MRKQRIPRILIGTLFVLLAVGCSNVLPEKNHLADTTETLVYSGSWYSREKWPHDGNPYESPNFIIYSDAASQGVLRPARK